MPHDLASDPSKTVFDYDAIISPPKDWERWYDLVRDLHRPPGRAVRRRGRRALVVRGVERGQPRGLLVRHAGGVPQAVRRHRRRGARRSTPGWSSADRRRPRPAGSRSCSRTPTRSGAPVDFVSTHTYGSPPLDFRPMLERYGRAGHADLVDRVGRHADALQRGQRRGLLRHVPAARDALGDGPDRVAVLLGRLRPLRGARPAAGAAARRLRAAHRRRAAQAALVGAGDAGAARVAPARRGLRRRRRRVAGRGGRGHRRPTTARTRCCSGTSPSTRPRPPGSGRAGPVGRRSR